MKLASNENPEGPLPAVLEAIARAARDINRYPDAACFHLTRRLAAQLDVDPRSLILGNGSNEVIDMLIRALVSPGETVVYSERSFIVYGLTTRTHFECGRAVPMAADDRHDLPAMAAAVDDTTKLVIVCDPNNPTGTYNTADEFGAFLEAVPARVIVAVDEAYYEYVTADDYPQTLPMLREHPNLVVLRTFSKIHCLAGLRVGYGVGHPDADRRAAEDPRAVQREHDQPGRGRRLPGPLAGGRRPPRTQPRAARVAGRRTGGASASRTCRARPTSSSPAAPATPRSWWGTCSARA